MDALADRAELTELMGRYADIADQKEFTRLPSLVFTDPLTLDFTSVTGAPSMTVALPDYVASLRSTFEPFVAAHHAITGHVLDVDGDRARIHAHVRAEHWLPDEPARGGSNRWLVVGFYDNQAVRTPGGWRLERVTLNATYQENADLLRSVLAGER